MEKVKVSIVIPCFNEESNIPLIVDRVENIVKKMNINSYEIILVDDGSSDRTLEKIKTICEKNKNIKGLSFTKNFGHQLALKAGIDNSNGEIVISMDADLQHPPELIEEMIKKSYEGYDIVYTVRDDRDEKNLFKKITSKLFYRIFRYLSEIEMDEGSADYRLITDKVVREIKKEKDPFIFLRGLIANYEFKSFKIKYKPSKRVHGESKYSFKKMLNLALSGIFGFSLKPLKILLLIGLILSMVTIFFYLFLMIFDGMDIKIWLIGETLSVLSFFVFFSLYIFSYYFERVFFLLFNRKNYIIKERKNLN
ncbi:MAG: glycosyltransferase family 2 protein [bacterium]|uniref:Family 2 glycosyl transferase n=2 Tax=Bacteria candidate phyla TaxID=1783234 RepID=A0A117M6L2_UNCT6|nr:MAG: family 2 glycosyl transferase [candidate division TA06 bacterium 32_111]KUK87162.1 MAG: family 2 glycosyl transferase [candidate division TA06 bacterium 34_109]MDI6699999.1 glycosyltransferase family 2 protein [bacterium]HAF07698.1 glycosyltransferase [candidate division WOR-3 bacterium]HCP17076.1 glycosyltransferase [candidate division WOR-3 bacterium]